MHDLNLVPTVENTFPNIVCIDDDLDVSWAIELRLKEFKVNVFRTYYGVQGFWETMRVKPQLIITDNRMPQGNGDYVVECLKRNPDTQNIPIIVYSGQSDTSLKQRMLGLGVNKFITKPVEFTELQGEIETIIELQPRLDFF
ncbi:MAG: hypothetical protein COA78_10365 [Blastopirellula sp.]|nr:MAG: hypothetical protein COA78_10365 [Blastopirellula sp.]